MDLDLRYPIGRFRHEGEITRDVVNVWIDEVERLPALIREAVSGLNDEQLDTPYRPGGWTVRQVVHHIADSHMNAYIRFKLALTEDRPVIKTYDENAWAELHDNRQAVEPSLLLIESLHARMAQLLRGLDDADWEKTFVHPAAGPISVGRNLGIYAWHGKHHVAHITSLRARMGW
jgi:hypothetical protein